MKEVIENNVIKTLSGMDKSLSLIKSYNEYVKSFKEKNKDIYNYFEQKFFQNDKIVEDIIKDLTKVSITDKNGILQLFFVKDGKEIFFDIEDLTKSNLDKVLAKYEEALSEEESELADTNARINQLKDSKLTLKPEKPRKILGIFPDLDDKERCQKAYKKKLRILDLKISDEVDTKNNLENDIECSKNKIYNTKSTIEFINSLTEEEKNIIIEKYNQVEKVFEIDQNDISDLNKFNSQIMPLADYISETFKVDSKKELFPLIKYLYGLYRNNRSETEYVEMSDLSKFVDFQQYKEEVDALAYAMYDQQFGKITPSRIKSYENDTFIRPKKKNHSIEMEDEEYQNGND